MSGKLREVMRDDFAKLMLGITIKVAQERNTEPTLGELADAIIDTYKLDEERHMVRFDSEGWTIQHPVVERITGTLFDCAAHENHAARLRQMPEEGPGDYWLTYRGLERVETDEH